VKRPAFQFYPGDWRSNAKLRRCSHAERGIWLEVLCLMHDAEEYGVLRWPLKDIALAVGCRPSELLALRAKGVLKGADAGERCEPFVFVPRHAGRDGAPVTLLEGQEGPIWYSSRMVRDEYVRLKKGEASRFVAQPKAAPKPPIGTEPMSGNGDGSSSSSSSSEKQRSTVGLAPDCPHERVIAAYHEILPGCPKVLTWNETRRRILRSRWLEQSRPNGTGSGYTTTEEGIAYWRCFFAYVSESDFLTGKTQGRDGRPPFVASLEWLLKPQNFAKVT